MTTPPPDGADFDAVADALEQAVDAIRRRDAETAAMLLFPPLPPKQAYARMVGSIVAAAALCGDVIREMEGPATRGDGFWALESRYVGSGLPIDPDANVAAANAVAVGRILAAAANKDYQMVADLTFAHLPPDAAPERSMILLELLLLYVSAREFTGE